MSFEQLEELKPLLECIDALQEEVDALKAARPDAYARIVEGWAVESTYNSTILKAARSLWAIPPFAVQGCRR